MFRHARSVDPKHIQREQGLYSIRMYVPVTCQIIQNCNPNDFICRNPYFSLYQDPSTVFHSVSPLSIPLLRSSSSIPWKDLHTSPLELRPQFCITNGNSSELIYNPKVTFFSQVRLSVGNQFVSQVHRELPMISPQKLVSASLRLLMNLWNSLNL